MSDDYAKYLRNLKKWVVYVGIPPEVANYTYPDGFLLSEIALSNEYGMDYEVPERSFLRLPLELKKSELKEKSLKIISNNMDARKTLEIIGELYRNVIIGAFETSGYGQWDENSPWTISMKHSSAPLINTGVLKSSISYTIRRN